MLSDLECRTATCPEGKRHIRLHDGGSLYLQVAANGSVGSLGCDALYGSLHALEGDLRSEPAKLPDSGVMQALATVSSETRMALVEFVR